MRVTPISRFALIAGLSLAGSWVVVRAADMARVWIPPVPWVVPALLLILTAIIGLLGRQVRRFLTGKNPKLDPLRAARTVVLAKAASYCGSFLIGWYGAQAIFAVAAARSGRSETLLMATIATIAAALLGVVGMIVERWCRIPPPEDEETVTGPEPTGEIA